MPLTQVSHEVVVDLMAGAVVSYEGSTRKDLLPGLLTWLLAGFNFSRAVGLSSLLAVDWRPSIVLCKVYFSVCQLTTRQLASLGESKQKSKSRCPTQATVVL